MLSAISFRKVATFNCEAIERGYGFDTDHDGKENLVYGGVSDTSIMMFWEHIGNDRYILENTCHFSQLFDIGYLDNDSLVDMVGLINGGWNYPTYVYESPDYYRNPTQIVWGDSMLPRQPVSVYIANLDGDTLHEMLISFWRNRYHTAIYETRGDNQYALVWEDTIHYANFFTWGDFDLDGKTEFVSQYSEGYVYVWECRGDNDYQFIFMDTLPHRANYDLFKGNDLDGNSRPEFFFSCVELYSHTIWLYGYEAISDNNYEYFLIDSITNLPLGSTSQRSWCGDIDADGREEIVWSTFNQWHIYKAVGIHQYQQIYSSIWTNHEITTLNVYDLNRNGYPEIIESWYEDGLPIPRQTVLWEIEGVRLHYPNGGEILRPGNPCLVRWEKFDPPGADSFSLFFSADSGRTYDTIATGISGSDASFQWTVPNTVSDSCRIMIWAYGPPRAGEQVPRGTAWDFSDSLFSIQPVGISEGISNDLKNLKLEVNPNPFSDKTTLNMKGNSTLPGNMAIKIYDISGRLVASLPMRIKNNVLISATVWDGKDNTGKQAPSGIYFIQVDGQLPFDAIKVIKSR